MTYPPDFTYPAQKRVTAHLAAASIAGLAAARRVVVQAGGCAGLWPLALSKRFERVFTFEPAPVNFRYLQANLARASNVVTGNLALGDRCASVGLTRPKPRAGLWRVEGEGDVPMLPLDEVLGEDIVVDALVLDVEGGEVPVWRGAERVIARDRPLLWFEYLHHADAIGDFLTAHGYARPERGVGNDWYSIHGSRVQS